MNATKICKECGVEFPATLDYFGLSKKSTGALNARCKPCWKLYKKQKNLIYKAYGNPLEKEPLAPIVREQTNRGTTIVRFGYGWKANATPRRLDAFHGYQGGSDT